MVNKPIVSVIVPAYNEECHIERAIRSILNQSFDDIEIIVVDDNSTDATAVIIHQLLNSDKRISLFKGPGIGPAGARNIGINNAKGRYICLMDADDISAPDRIEKLFERCRRHTKAVVSSYADILNARGELIKSITYPESNVEIRKGFARLFNRSVIHPVTIMAHTDLLKKHKYREGFRYLEDWDLILRIAEDPDVIFETVPEGLYKYCLNEGSLTMNITTRNKYNIMVWYNDFQRKRGKPEALSILDFERRMRKDVFSYIIYRFLLSAKFVQQGFWVWKIRRLLSI